MFTKHKRTCFMALAAALALLLLAGFGGRVPFLAAAENPSAKGGRYGALRVEGTSLLGSKGEAVQLRGISSHGLAWYPEFVNADALRQMAEEWGCTVFRLAMYTEEDGYCTTDDKGRAAQEKLIDSTVQAANGLGMYVIIDWHILSDGNPLTYQDQAAIFFSTMAERYAGYDNVIYEICNEPNGDTTWEDVRQYAEAVIPAIRAHSDAVVLVGAPGWTHDIGQAAERPLDQFENVMYTFHFYAATHGAQERALLENAVRAGLPVFVSEYGICEATGDGEIDEAEADRWLALLDRLGISHVMWNFSNKNESAAFLLSSCRNTDSFTGGDLSRSGQWFISRVAAG